MPTFTPPTVNTVPRFLPDSVGQQKALFKFYKPSAAFVQVFLLSDGTYVQNYSTPENTNTDIPYPWNPNDPGGPYAWGSYVDYDQDPPKSVEFKITRPFWITKLYDRPITVTQAEADALSAFLANGIGYAACIS